MTLSALPLALSPALSLVLSPALSLAFSLAMFAMPVAIVALALLLAAHDWRRQRRREASGARRAGGSGT